MYTDCMLGLLQCCLLPISYCLLPIARCRLTIAHCLSPSASVLEVVSCLAIYVLLDAFNFWDVHYGFWCGMCNGFSCARMKAHCEMMELEEHTQHTFMSIRINVRHIAAWAPRCQLVIAGIPCDPLSCRSLIPLLYTHTPLCILPSTCYLWIWAQVALSYLSRLSQTLTFNVATAVQQAWWATLYSSVTNTQYVKAISFIIV